MLTPRRTSDSATAAIAIGTAAGAIACCADLPAIGAFLGGLTLGGILGAVLLGAVLLGVVTWAATATLVRRRRRPRCDERIRDE